MNGDFGLNGFEFGIAGHDTRACSFCQSNAESVGIGNGILSFDVSRGEYERSICGDYPERELINNTGCTLGLSQSLLTFCDIQAFAVIDQRKEHDDLFLSGSSQNLPDFLRCRFSFQISQHCPGI